MHNMLIPGQVEKWTIYLNVNKFALKDMPIKIFQAAADQLGANQVDHGQKTYIVNLTFAQTIAGKVLQKFLDADTVAKQFISSKPDDPKILQFISKSQLRHGGTAPDVTRYWPPTMPEYTDFNEAEATCKFIPKAQYNDFISQHPGLTVMPRSLRTDLPPLPQDPVEQVTAAVSNMTVSESAATNAQAEEKKETEAPAEEAKEETKGDANQQN